MQISHTDEEIHAKAVQLGLIQKNDELPRAMRGKVLATLLREQPKATPAADPVLANEIVVQPGGQILVDGEPFPWLVAKQPMEIGLDPDGISTVRMTLLSKSVQIIKPEPKEEPR